MARGTGQDAAVTGRTADYSFSSQKYRGQAVVLDCAHLSQWLNPCTPDLRSCNLGVLQAHLWRSSQNVIANPLLSKGGKGAAQ